MKQTDAPVRHFLRRVKRRLLGTSHEVPTPRVIRPREECGRVIVTGFGPGGYHGHGKVSVDTFFPPFAEVLAEHGIATCFASEPKRMRTLAHGNACIIHVYREVTDAERLAAMDLEVDGVLTFNRPSMGRIIANKLATHKLMVRNGVAVPELVSEAAAPVFSNEMQSSGAQVTLVSPGSALDHSRYNTRFIDTRVEVEGQEYHTTVRLMCVGAELLHAYVRARPTSDASPSVHAADTPLDPALVETLQARLVEPRWPVFRDLAARLAEVLGPGFYSHDLLVECGTGLIYLAEPGYKFDDMSYTKRLRPIAASLPSHRHMFTDVFARQSASALLREYRRSGLSLE